MKYIIWFAQEHVEFRSEEIQSILKAFNIKVTKDADMRPELPYWIVEFQNESDVHKLASRSVSIKSISELWASGTSFTAFHENLKTTTGCGKSPEYEEYFKEDRDFKIIVETYNKHFTQSEKVAKIEALDYLQFKAPANLRNPKELYMYIEFWGLDPMNVPEQPDSILFGRWITNGQREMLNKISLKTRKFIGNTSMDPALSILMVNQAAVRPGDLVLDPFVGTGSLLVTAAIYGGFVFGSDIDYMMLHGKTRPSRITQKMRDPDESVASNFAQYGCQSQYLDVFVADFSQNVWRDDFKFDAIITDPPYGIREATEKVKSNVEKPAAMNDDEKLVHYPSTTSYNLFNLVADLLNFAAAHLNVGGRLVFWMPFHRADYKDTLIPRHASLELKANSEQVLSTFISRRLLTFEKILDPPASGDKVEASVSEQYEFDFRNRYFDPADLTRVERRQQKYEQKMAYMNGIKKESGSQQGS